MLEIVLELLQTAGSTGFTQLLPMENEPKSFVTIWHRKHHIFVTLKNTNSFVQHDGSNWIVYQGQCQSSLKLPLKRVEFTKIKIRIEVFLTL